MQGKGVAAPSSFAVDPQTHPDFLRGAPLRRVPGSCVGPVGPKLSFLRLPELLFSCSSSLGFFARSSLRRPQPAKSGSEPHPIRAGGVWPMPPPYPEVRPGDHRRLPDGLLRKLVVNAIVMVRNYLDLGKVERAPASCIFGKKLNSIQAKHVMRLESFLEAWFQLGTLTAVEMGRTAGKVEDLERVLSNLQHSIDQGSLLEPSPISGAPAGSELGRLQGTKIGTFKEVEASHLKFRGYPDFDPALLRSYLQEHLRLAFRARSGSSSIRRRDSQSASSLFPQGKTQALHSSSWTPAAGSGSSRRIRSASTSGPVCLQFLSLWKLTA